MDKKISELPLASSIAGTEYVPIVQGGVTKKVLASAFGGSPDLTDYIKRDGSTAATTGQIDIGVGQSIGLTDNSAQLLFIPDASVLRGDSRVILDADEGFYDFVNSTNKTITHNFDSATVDREVVWQDKDITVAGLDDIASAVSSYIPLTQKGAVSGVATLGADGTLPLAQGAKVGTVTPNNSPIVLGDDLQAIADKATGQINDINDQIKRGYLSPKLRNWYLKLASSPTTAKMTWVGDSTSDFSGNAVSIPTYVNSQYCQTGDVLAGFNTTTNMPNFGSNGNTIVAWNSNPAASKGLNDLIAANPDLVIFSYGINDVRQNLLTKDQLKAQIIIAINSIIAGLPNADIVLRMPNSFMIPSTDFYIKQGSYPSLAAAAQGQTDILYNAYKELEDYWPNVHMLNTQALIFGRTCLASSTLMTDEIHPYYGGIVDEVAKVIGYKISFSKNLSLDAISKSYTTPWIHYPMVVENKDYFELIGEGRLQIITSTYIEFSCDSAILLGSNILQGMAILIGDVFLSIIPFGFTWSPQTPTTLRILFTIPANTITGGAVKIYKHKYNYCLASEAYVKDKRNYPYARTIQVVSGGANYFDITAKSNNKYFDKDHPIPLSGKLGLLATNTIVFADNTTLVLTGASFGALNDTTLRVFVTGSFSSKASTLVQIFGTQPYEPYFDKAQFTLIYPDVSLTQNIGDFGYKGGFFKGKGIQGESSLASEIKRVISEPAGDTITNTTTKTYFNSTLALPTASLVTGEYIRIEAWFLLSGAAVPGNLQIGVDLVGATTATVVNTTSFSIETNANQQLLKMVADIFIKTNAAAGIVGAEGLIINSESATGNFLPMKRTADLTPFNTTVAITVSISAQFTVADVANIIKMKAIKFNTIKP